MMWCWWLRIAVIDDHVIDRSSGREDPGMHVVGSGIDSIMSGDGRHDTVVGVDVEEGKFNDQELNTHLDQYNHNYRYLFGRWDLQSLK